MGIGVDQWRMRIGGFSQPTAKDRFRPATLKVPCMMRPSFGLLLTLSVLLVIGGVETNPGPPKKQEGDWKKDLDKVKDEMTALRKLVEDLLKENKKLKMSITRLEDQGRNKNLIFYGFEEEEEETWQECENKIKQTIQDEYGYKVEDKEIERAFRVGKKRDKEEHEEEPKPRPIICKFSSVKTRSKVLTDARSTTREKRKNKIPLPTVKVSEDFSPEVRETRRKLTTILIEKKEEAERKNDKDFRCYLRHDKLVVNKDVYQLDEDGELSKI